MKRNNFKSVLLLLALLLAPGMNSAWTSKAAAADSPQTAEDRRMLFRRGARLWPIYCNTCHNARPGADFSPVEWNMIIMHMRTQANLTGEDARAVLEYLKSSR